MSTRYHHRLSRLFEDAAGRLLGDSLALWRFTMEKDAAERERIVATVLPPSQASLFLAYAEASWRHNHRKWQLIVERKPQLEWAS